MAISRVIGCISSKGGIGKTTSAINLAAALTYFGKNVILVDANFTSPNVGVYLGNPVNQHNLHDVLRGKKEALESVFHHSSGIKFLPGSIALKDTRKIDHHKLTGVVRDLDGHSDFIVLDGAPGLTKEALSVVKALDEVVIVTTPEMPALTDALKTVKVCKELRKDILGVLVTKTNAKNPDVSLKDIEAMLDVPVIGVIPEDRAVKHALVSKQPVVASHPKSASAVQYKKLAADLLNLKYEESIQTPNSSFVNSFLKWMGFKD